MKGKYQADFREFERRVEAFRQNPSIQEYVELRRLPFGSFDTSTTGGLEFVFAQENELRSAGIKPQMVAAALDADEREQSALALVLLEKLVEREALEREGETHVVSRKKGISDSLVNYLIALMLDALDFNGDNYVCQDLMVLIKHQLGAGVSEYEVKMRVHEKRKSAIWIAAQLLAVGEAVTYRSVAERLGVQPSTVKRWFAGGSLIEEARLMASLVKNLKVFATKRGVLRGNYRAQRSGNT